MIVCAAPMGAFAWLAARAGEWERGGNDPTNVGLYVGAVLGGALIYLGAAKALRAPELDDVLGALRRKLRRS